MPDEFEWQTDVDMEWDELTASEARPATIPGRRVKIAGLLILLCILAGGAVWVYGTVSGRVEVATDTTESDVLLAHDLLVNGALRGDFDVVETLIASRPSAWHGLQVELMARELFFGRRPLGIEVDRSNGRDEAMASLVQLSPDLTAAEVTDRRPYIAGTGSGLTQTILLERTFLYDKIDDQWLLSAPADDRAFWGNWVRDVRDQHTMIYPARDEKIANRLASYLDGFLVDLCASQQVDCPPDFHLDFKLEIDPASVRRLGDGLFPIQVSQSTQAHRLQLPAPSLIGLPLDEAGYQALQRGYASWIGAAIIGRYHSPDLASGTEATASVLAELELRPPPYPVQPLPRPALATFPADAPTPPQDVLMLCRGPSSLRLLRLNTASGHWQEEVPAELWPQTLIRSNSVGYYLSRLPNYQGALIQSASGGPTNADQEVWRTHLWKDGLMRLISEDTAIHYYLPPSLQPPNQPAESYLAFYVPGQEDGGPAFGAMGLDLAGCQSYPCHLDPLEGLPIWSPDGQRTVVIVSEPDGAESLLLGDETGQVGEPIGRGQSPLWLDESRFSYIALHPGAERDSMGRTFGREVLLTTISAGQDGPELSQEVLFDSEMVRQTIPEAVRPQELALWSAQPALNGETWWIIGASATGDSDPKDYISVFNAQSGEARLSADLGRFRLIQSPMVSPLGSYAIVPALSPDGSDVSVELLDASSGRLSRLESFFPTDWSADDQWLIQIERGPLTLVATATGQRWVIEHDLPGCYTAVWTEREQ